MNLQDMTIEKLNELLKKHRASAEKLRLAECCVLIAKACVYTKTASTKRPPADVVRHRNDGLRTWELGKRIRIHRWPSRIIVTHKNRKVLDVSSFRGWDEGPWRYWTYHPNDKWVDFILEMAASIDMDAIKAQAEVNSEECRRQYLINKLSSVK